MADQAALISKIRRTVHDSDLETEGRPLYADAFYEDALSSGMSIVNLDLDTAYTIATLPAKYEILLELRGKIEMCRVRAGEGGSSDVSDQPETPLQMLTVPNLSVQKMATPPKGPQSWADMCKELEELYNRLLGKAQESEGGVLPEGAIQQAVMSRRSMRTGRRRPYNYDAPLDAVLLAVSAAAGTVYLTWDAVYDERFDRYEVERDTDLAMSSPEVLAKLTDNHTVAYDDTPEAGTWYYRVVVYNDNNLAAESAVATAVV